MKRWTLATYTICGRESHLHHLHQSHWPTGKGMGSGGSACSYLRALARERGGGQAPEPDNSTWREGWASCPPGVGSPEALGPLLLCAEERAQRGIPESAEQRQGAQPLIRACRELPPTAGPILAGGQAGLDGGWMGSQGTNGQRQSWPLEGWADPGGRPCQGEDMTEAGPAPKGAATLPPGRVAPQLTCRQAGVRRSC